MIQYKCNENYIYVHTLETEYQHIKNYFVKGVVFMMMIPRRNDFYLFETTNILNDMVLYQATSKIGEPKFIEKKEEN